MMDRSAKIYVAGHRGLVGSALVRRLEQGGYANILVRTHAELDLLDQAASAAVAVGLPQWRRLPLRLDPKPELIQLVKRSRDKADSLPAES